MLDQDNDVGWMEMSNCGDGYGDGCLDPHHSRSRLLHLYDSCCCCCDCCGVFEVGGDNCCCYDVDVRLILCLVRSLVNDDDDGASYDNVDSMEM